MKTSGFWSVYLSKRYRQIYSKLLTILGLSHDIWESVYSLMNDLVAVLSQLEPCFPIHGMYQSVHHSCSPSEAKCNPFRKLSAINCLPFSICLYLWVLKRRKECRRDLEVENVGTCVDVHRPQMDKHCRKKRGRKICRTEVKSYPSS